VVRALLPADFRPEKKLVEKKLVKERRFSAA